MPNIFDPNYGLDPLQQSLAGFQAPRPPNGLMQPGPTGNGMLSALQGQDPTAAMLMGAAMLSASGPQPRKMGFGARLGGAVGQALPQILNQQSIQERTALAKQELAQRESEHQMAVDSAMAVSKQAIALRSQLDKNGDGVVDDAKNQELYDSLGMAAISGDHGDVMTALGRTPKPPEDASFGKGAEGAAYDWIVNTYPESQRPAIRTQIAAELAARDQTVVTPQGTYVMPGISVKPYGQSAPSAGGATGGPGRFYGKEPSTAQEIAKFASGNMLDLDSNTVGVLKKYPQFDPTSSKNLLREWAPESLKSYASSPALQQYHAAADRWSALGVYLISGVAVRPEEKVDMFSNYFPQPGDDKATVALKDYMRTQYMLGAYQKGLQEGRVPSDKARDILGKLSADLVAKKATWEQSQGGTAPITPKADVEELIKRNLPSG